jgi:hypothetical protein
MAASLKTKQVGSAFHHQIVLQPTLQATAKFHKRKELGVIHSPGAHESKLANVRARKRRRQDAAMGQQHRRHEMEGRWYRRRESRTVSSSAAAGESAGVETGVHDAPARAATRAAQRTRAQKEADGRRREHERNNRWYLKRSGSDGADVALIQAKAQEQAKQALRLLHNERESTKRSEVERAHRLRHQLGMLRSRAERALTRSCKKRKRADTQGQGNDDDKSEDRDVTTGDVLEHPRPFLPGPYCNPIESSYGNACVATPRRMFQTLCDERGELSKDETRRRSRSSKKRQTNFKSSDQDS